MTALDARRLAQLAAYRSPRNASRGVVPAATVHDNAATRPIHTHHTGLRPCMRCVRKVGAR